MANIYESEILYKLMERDGFNIPSSVPPYESEIKAYLIEQVKLAYPKLTDYEAEWLLYNYTKHIPAEFPLESITNVTNATVNNVVPYAYKSAILKGNTKYCDIDTGDILDTFDETKNLELVSVKMPVLTTTGKNLVFLDKNNPDALGSSSGGGTSAIKYDNEKQAFYTSGHRRMCSNIIFKPNTYYIISAEFLLREKNSYSFKWNNPQQSMGSTGSNTPFNETTWVRRSIKRLSNNNGGISWVAYQGVWFRNLQIEEAESLTEYEPYKSNILSCLEPVELGSVGEVKDELNLLTQQLTQRTETRPYQEGDELNSEFVTDMTNTRYKLAQEVVKTVDLSVVGENGNKINHFMPIEGTMHIQTDGEPVKPSVTMEIPVEATTQNLASFIEMEV